MDGKQSNKKSPNFVPTAERLTGDFPCRERPISYQPEQEIYPTRGSATKKAMENYKLIPPDHLYSNIAAEHEHLSSSKRHDTASDRLRQLYIKLKDARTQTSPAESSTVSEQSLLETPMPRSKIPVPYRRYTPKREKKNSRKVRFSSDKKSPQVSRKGKLKS